MSAILTEEERKFCLLVLQNPGGKLGEAEAYHPTGTNGEDLTNVSLWVNPEKLGLIESVGSYKWKPTQKLYEFLVDSLGEDLAENFVLPSCKLEVIFHKRLQRLGLEGNSLHLSRRQRGHIMGALRECIAEVLANPT